MQVINITDKDIFNLLKSFVDIHFNKFILVYLLTLLILQSSF